MIFHSFSVIKEDSKKIVHLFSITRHVGGVITVCSQHVSVHLKYVFTFNFQSENDIFQHKKEKKNDLGRKTSIPIILLYSQWKFILHFLPSIVFNQCINNLI